jgi:hypothetical protein
VCSRVSVNHAYSPLTQYHNIHIHTHSLPSLPPLTPSLTPYTISQYTHTYTLPHSLPPSPSLPLPPPPHSLAHSPLTQYHNIHIHTYTLPPPSPLTPSLPHSLTHLSPVGGSGQLSLVSAQLVRPHQRATRLRELLRLGTHRAIRQCVRECVSAWVSLLYLASMRK